MKVEDCKKIKREQIEISFKELLKYIYAMKKFVVIFAVVLAVVIPSLKYVLDLNSISNAQNNVNTEGEKELQKNKDDLEYYEKIYDSELEYKNNSLLMQLDYKNIAASNIQYNVTADDEMLYDVMNAYYNYINNGGLVADIYKVDNSIDTSYMQEVIYGTCSNLESYNVSSVINIKIYALNEDMSHHYTDMVKSMLEQFSLKLNNNGFKNAIILFNESYFIGQDINIRYIQDDCYAALVKFKTSISNVEANIKALENNTIIGNNQPLTFSFKFLLIGLIMGIIIAIVIVVIRYIVSEKIKYAKEVYEITNIPLIGSTCNKKGKNSLNGNGAILSKIKVLSSNKDEIFVVGNASACKNEIVQSIFYGVDKESTSIKVLGDVINDVDAMNNMKLSKNVILLVSPKETTYTYLEDVLECCKMMDENILGYIFIE